MPNNLDHAVHPRRRSVLHWGAAAGTSLSFGPGLLRAAESSDASEPPRLALLIGNRNYPDGEDLPPIHKNVRDLHEALEKRGFTVTDAVDLDLADARALMARFSATVKAASPDATVFFYFSGHGAQVDAENLLVSSGVNPKARPETLARGSMILTKDVLDLLPHRPEGMTIAVVDACRTSLRALAQGEGLNQVEAPPGCLIAFSTGAGKPAIAPDNDKSNTFYTASLVRLLNSASGETPFSDLFRLVKTDTQNTMLNYPVAILRQFAQEPFIAENLKIRRRVAPRVVNAAPPPRKEDESAAWARLEALIWPPDVARVANQYIADYPGSALVGSAQVARDGALEAAKILRRNDVRLYRSAFQYSDQTPADEVDDIIKAGRGDKDAAARLGQRHTPKAELGSGGIDKTGRFEGWMQYAAALSNGIASYRLALYYRRSDQPQLASQFEALARKLGYTPPPSLDNSRK